MEDKITWLHISDIHFSPITSWRDNTSRTSLLRHLERLIRDEPELRPDLIFCTGDIAFGEMRHSPLSEQYLEAAKFFDDLLVICGSAKAALPKERLFIVPGNHDIDRGKINLDAQKALKAQAEESEKYVHAINQRFNDRTTEHNDSLRRLDAYGSFVSNYLPHIADPTGRHHYAHTIEIKGIKIGIAGFNSAWSCAGPEDDRNIWIAANWQFNKAETCIADTDIKIGLIHHPTDWINQSDRDHSTLRIASDFHFWLHGHTHNAWVTPVQSHIVIAAGAVGAKESEEFGINITTLDTNKKSGAVHLYNKRNAAKGWVISPVDAQAPKGVWNFNFPESLASAFSKNVTLAAPLKSLETDPIERLLSSRLDAVLKTFSSQPKVWVRPKLSQTCEALKNGQPPEFIDPSELVENPQSTIISAPPQYGLTCLTHFLVLEAWKSKRAFWLHLDAKDLKPHQSSITEARDHELSLLGLLAENINCVVLDSWSSSDKDAAKLLKTIFNFFPGIPIFCMSQIDTSRFEQLHTQSYGESFKSAYFLWALPRSSIRDIVIAYNAHQEIGDEDAVTKKLVADLDVLNLHRTPLNCLTLLKVSEVDFDESPVNRTEMIRRVLFLLFNVDDVPTYKARPDLKDCEFVLGYFCETLIRSGTYSFTRDKFLLEIRQCCESRLIDLETHVVFDVLFRNNIIVLRGNLFYFKFSYWILYFSALRMHHDNQFAEFILQNNRYAQNPEIIEFYTGFDRRREDALKILQKDLRGCIEAIKEMCGLPEELNPYKYAQWEASDEMQSKMHKEIVDGVKESNLPAAIKDQYADRTYDQAKPYNQDIAAVLSEHSFHRMIQTMKAASRALRNSDYVDPDIKRELLREILDCWDISTKVLLVILPILALEDRAMFGGSQFILQGDFGKTKQEKMLRILLEIPFNIISWCGDDLFSQKMGPLLLNQAGEKPISEISTHELILLIIQQRPRNWDKTVHNYISSVTRNSFYLHGVLKTLRNEYRFGYASNATLKDMESLIKIAATKHLTGIKDPGIKAMKKVKFSATLIPPRDVS